MSNDERHRDIGEAVDSLSEARTARGCLQSRLTKFRSQIEAVAEILRKSRLTIVDDKIVRYGAAAEGELVYPDRQELCDAIEQHDAAVKQYDEARIRCHELGLAHVIDDKPTIGSTRPL